MRRRCGDVERGVLCQSSKNPAKFHSRYLSTAILGHANANEIENITRIEEQCSTCLLRLQLAAGTSALPELVLSRGLSNPAPWQPTLNDRVRAKTRSSVQTCKAKRISHARLTGRFAMSTLSSSIRAPLSELRSPDWLPRVK